MTQVGSVVKAGSSNKNACSDKTGGGIRSLSSLVCYPPFIPQYHVRVTRLGENAEDEAWYLFLLTVPPACLRSICLSKMLSSQIDKQEAEMQFQVQASRYVWVSDRQLVTEGEKNSAHPSCIASRTSVRPIRCSHIHPPHVISLAWQKTCNCRTDGRLYKLSLQ